MKFKPLSSNYYLYIRKKPNNKAQVYPNRFTACLLDDFLLQKERSHMSCLPQSDYNTQRHLNDGPPENSRVQNFGNFAEALFSVSLKVLLLLNLRNLVGKLDNLKLKPRKFVFFYHALIKVLVFCQESDILTL